jgi:hypothetical protein
VLLALLCSDWRIARHDVPAPAILTALPPKAEAHPRSCYVAEVPFATECTAAKASLFDHLVGAAEDRWRHSQTERLGGLEVEHQLILSRHLHRQIGRLLALENAIDVSCRAPVGIDRVGPVGDQAAAGDEVVDFAIKLRYQRQFDEAYESLSDCLMSRASPIRSSSLSNSFAASSRRRCEGQRKLRERYSCAVAPLPS